jgi:hypothetical protein
VAQTERLPGKTAAVPSGSTHAASGGTALAPAESEVPGELAPLPMSGTGDLVLPIPALLPAQAGDKWNGHGR